MPSDFRTRALRVITVGLLVDILAFTMILPLFPRLLEFYSKDPNPVRHFMFPWKLLVGVETKTTTSRPSFQQPWTWFKSLGYLLGSKSRRGWILCSLEARLGRSSRFFSSSRVLGSDDWVIDLDGEEFCFLVWYVTLPFACWEYRLIVKKIGNAVSMGLWIFAKSFDMFLLSRVVGGLTEGNVQMSVAMISDLTPSETRSQSLACFFKVACSKPNAYQMIGLGWHGVCIWIHYGATTWGIPDDGLLQKLRPRVFKVPALEWLLDSCLGRPHSPHRGVHLSRDLPPRNVWIFS